MTGNGYESAETCFENTREIATSELNFGGFYPYETTVRRQGGGVGGAHATHVTVGRTTSPPLRSQGSHHLRVSRAISRKIRQLSSIARPVRLSDVI